MSFTIANYEPRPQMPLTLRPVLTPGNNPGLFADKERQAARDAARTGRGATNSKGLMLPGSTLWPFLFLRPLMS
jgi:chromatin structure-remodeling complex subunit RSC9